MSLLHPQMDPMSSLPNDLLHIIVHSESIPLTDLHNAVHVVIGAHRLPELSPWEDILPYQKSSHDLHKSVFSACIWIYVN
jgi:hypothetical protein